MLHVAFAMYLVSLLSGVLLLGALGAQPRYRAAAGFREFVVLYLFITVFVCVSALCLYLSVNVAAGEAARQPIFRTYLTVILLFLGILPRVMENYSSTLYRFTAPPWFTGFWRFCLLYAVAAAIVVWWQDPRWYVPLVAFSMALFVVALSAVSWWSRDRYDEVFRSRSAKIVSQVMVGQSLGLPLIEILFWSEDLARNGYTFSLPVLYLLNNAMLWIWREEMMPRTLRTESAIDKESRLSPKEREIVRALADGLSNKQIAARLGITPSTVKNHIYSIFKKCNVNSRIALLNHLARTD
jgi:DNA-binding CsgD family transcriptional regulator